MYMSKHCLDKLEFYLAHHFNSILCYISFRKKTHYTEQYIYNTYIKHSIIIYIHIGLSSVTCTTFYRVLNIKILNLIP